MKMAKASERDIDAAGNAMSALQDISSGYYPKREGDDEDTPLHFDPEDPQHLRRFYDLMNATLDASPGWPGRVIGGMCYALLWDENKIVDPNADTLELHPRLAAAPELLRVLQQLFEIGTVYHGAIESEGPGTDFKAWAESAHAAIRKATGAA